MCLVSPKIITRTSLKSLFVCIKCAAAADLAHFTLTLETTTTVATFDIEILFIHSWYWFKINSLFTLLRTVFFCWVSSYGLNFSKYAWHMLAELCRTANIYMFFRRIFIHYYLSRELLIIWTIDTLATRSSISDECDVWTQCERTVTVEVAGNNIHWSRAMDVYYI